MSEVFERLLLGLGAALYFGSFFLSLKRFSSSQKAEKAGKALYIAALILNVGLIAYNYVRNVSLRGAFYIPFISVR